MMNVFPWGKRSSWLEFNAPLILRSRAKAYATNTSQPFLLWKDRISFFFLAHKDRM